MLKIPEGVPSSLCDADFYLDYIYVALTTGSMLHWKKAETEMFREPRLGADVRECEPDIRRGLFHSSMRQGPVYDTMSILFDF